MHSTIFKHCAILFALLLGCIPDFSSASPVKRQSSRLCSGLRSAGGGGAWSTIRVSYSTFTRSSDIYLPSSYSPGQRIPTLLALHNSHTEGGRSFAVSQGLVTMAEKFNFMILAPTGSVRYTGQRDKWAWNISFVPAQDASQVDQAGSLHTSDRPYLGAVLDHAASYDCVDAKASWAFGFSGGARMASSLACQSSLSLKVGAIAVASGLRAGPADPSANPRWSEVLTRDIAGKYACNPGHGIGIMAFHGTDDTIAPYKGNTIEQWGYSVDKAARRFSTLLGCNATPDTTVLPDSPNITKKTWHCSRSRAALELYVIKGFGHQVPKDDARSPVGTNFHHQQRMWQFVSTHCLVHEHGLNSARVSLLILLLQFQQHRLP